MLVGEIGKHFRWRYGIVPDISKSPDDKVIIFYADRPGNVVFMTVCEFTVGKGLHDIHSLPMDDLPSSCCDLTNNMIMVNSGETPRGGRAFFLNNLSGMNIY